MPVQLDPDAAAVYQAFLRAARPGYETLTATDARASFLQAAPATNPEPPELARVAPLSIPAPHGTIPARIYVPTEPRQHDGLSPALVFFHGGGWVVGDLDSHDVVCRQLADAGALVVIAIDYRRAPEHKFPAAVDDAIAATRWIAGNARELGLDPARISVGGDSAGGNLAAVAALAARDDNSPAIAAQLLIYPAVDFAMTHGSHSEPETGVLLTHAVVRWFRDHYLNGAADIHDWRASPARVQDLAGLPPAYVLTAGADPLRDEGDEYAARLKQAGVSVTHKHLPGQFHGFLTMGKLLPQANLAVREIGAWLKGLG
jgi:acetyl esterase